MKEKKTIIIIIAIILVLIILGGIGFMYFAKYMAFYKPGNLGKNMEGKLDVEKQDLKDEGYFKVEDDIDLYYFTQGKGDIPVLIIHGGPGAPASSKWDALESLGDKYKFYYYHQRGCGKSTKPFDRFESSNTYQNMGKLDEKLGMTQQLSDIERIRKILGVEKLILLGHSYGGFMATLYSIEFPENVEKMVLVSPANLLKMPQEEDSFEDMKSYLSDEKKLEFDAWQAEYFDYDHIFEKSESDLQKINIKYLNFYLAAMRAKEGGSGNRLILPFIEDDESLDRNLEENIGGWMVHGLYISTGIKYDYRELLKDINIPSQVLYGEDEFLTSVYEDHSNLLGNSEARSIKGASHFSFSEKPAEFSNLVKKFLNN
ncbi:MAG: alpha/beta hydrolase [Parcubacteria group bacterium]|nr:alpha/beta hydrolase [Parcubacteria group bacterium]